MTLQELYDALFAHDWHYHYASGTPYYKGVASWQRIESAAQQSPDHKKLVDDVVAYIAGRGPKPDKPEVTL